MTRVRYVSTSLALCYDSKNDRVVKVRSLIDSEGREWERYDEGLPVLLESPAEPAKRSRKHARNSK